MEGKVIARGVALGIAALLLNTAFAILWVWLYSVIIDPGHDGAFYQAYAQRVAPIAGFICGIPLLLAAGWLAARGRPGGVTALIPAMTYVVLDLALMAAGNLWASPVALLLSSASKAAAAWAGGRIARARRR
jgi:hypothetical protein